MLMQSLSRKPICLFAAACLAMTISTGLVNPVFAVNAEFKTLLTKGAALDAAVKYSESVIVYTKAITVEPTEALGYYRRGLAYFHDAKYEHAISDLSKAIEINPNYQDAYLIRGRAYSESGQLTKSILDYEWVTKNDPQFKEAFDLMALSYEKLLKKDLSKSISKQSVNLPFRSQLADGEPAIPDYSKHPLILAKQIRSKWKPPRRMVSHGTIVKYKLHRNHAITDIKIKYSSEDSIFDKAAMDAIRQASGEPFPPGAPEDLDGEFSFDYNYVDWPGLMHRAANKPLAAATAHANFKQAIVLLGKEKYNEANALFLKTLEFYKTREKDEHAVRRVRAISDGLGIGYEELSKKVKSNNDERISYLHKSLYYRPGAKESEKALDEAIQRKQRDPQKADDRILLGDEAKAAGDFYGADVEYQEALKLREDKAVRSKLEALREAHGVPPANM